jgi:hypothetical protein
VNGCGVGISAVNGRVYGGADPSNDSERSLHSFSWRDQWKAMASSSDAIVSVSHTAEDEAVSDH